VRNVGRSVGILYSINTLGSATACFVSAFWLMQRLGMQNSIWIAAAINVLVGVTGLCMAYYGTGRNQATPTPLAFEVRSSFPAGAKIKLFFAFIVSIVIGYIALSYEIIWFRAFVIGTNVSQAFALILGAYLGGLAVGSWWARRYFSPNATNTQLLYVLCAVILLSLPWTAGTVSFSPPSSSFSPRP
jgi:hypothetical protein